MIKKSILIICCISTFLLSNDCVDNVCLSATITGEYLNVTLKNNNSYGVKVMGYTKSVRGSCSSSDRFIKKIFENETLTYSEKIVCYKRWSKTTVDINIIKVKKDNSW